MAGKNQVTLTFAGDSKSLERTLGNVGDSAKKTEGDFDKLGDGAKQAEEDLARVGAGAKKAEADFDSVGSSAEVTGDRFRRSSKSAEEHATRLDRLGESADVGESRFIGLASGIDGATSLMDDPSPQEMAQGIADLSDGIAKTAVPWMIKMRDATSSAIQSMGGMKNVLIGGGVIAAVAGVGFALHQAAQEAREARFDDVAKDLAETGDAVQAAKDALGGEGPDFTNPFSTVSDDVQNLHEVLTRLTKEGNFQEARDLIAEAGERGDISAGQMRALTNMIDELEGSTEGAAAAQRNLAEEIRGVTDAMAARADPVFAVIDADNQLRDANQGVADALGAVNDAIKEHGEASPEAAQAAQDLRDAQMGAAEAALGSESALRELTAAAVENPAIVDQVIGHLQSLANQGHISQGSVDAVSRALRDVPRRTDATLAAHDRATGIIRSVAGALGTLDGSSATVTINANTIIRSVVEGFGFGGASGGIAPEYHAAGGMTRGNGPRGTDTVPAWLTPGEMILNKAQQAQLFAMANGRGVGRATVHQHFHIAGSVLAERDLIRVINHANAKGRGLN